MKLKTKHGDEFEIDKEDYPLINDLSFGTQRVKYKGKEWLYVRCSNGELLHRFIMSPKKGEIIDHIDNNGLNNKRENLRKCTYKDNQGNRKSTHKTSKYKGVSSCTTKYIEHLYRAQIRCDGKTINLGRWDNELEAAKAYDKAAKEYFGEYAKTNKDLGLL